MNTLIDRFLKYVSYNTQSDHESDNYPSTKSQLEFAKILALECEGIGLSNVFTDEFGYVFATLPSNRNVKVPTIAFISHMDTSSDASGENIKPKIIKNYDGTDIKLNENLILSPKEFPHLEKYIGQDLITTDGTTLLGADDKAGIAEIITAMEYLINNPQILHGEVKICLTPDEEIGRGVDKLNMKNLNADFGFTIDGGEIGEFECECFNAALAKINIKGKSVHPGVAKNIMINACLVAGEIIEALPKNEAPQSTFDYEGFYHVTSFSGIVESAKLEIIIRDFDKGNFNKRKDFITEIINNINKKYGENTACLIMKDQYYNMYEILKDKKEIMDLAKKAFLLCDVTPILKPIRGGTDGSRLSFMGLPCPNIFTGGHNFHGPFEFIPINSMEKSVEIIVKLCELNL